MLKLVDVRGSAQVLIIVSYYRRGEIAPFMAHRLERTSLTTGTDRSVSASACVSIWEGCWCVMLFIFNILGM